MRYLIIISDHVSYVGYSLFALFPIMFFQKIFEVKYQPPTVPSYLISWILVWYVLPSNRHKLIFSSENNNLYPFDGITNELKLMTFNHKH